MVGDTITLSQNMVADIRASFLRFVNVTLPLSCCNFQFSTLGPGWAQYQTRSTFPELPQPNVTGMNNFNTIPTIHGHGQCLCSVRQHHSDLGRHTLQYGGEMRKIEWDYVQSNSSGATIWTLRRWHTAAMAFADFMLGTP